MPTVPKPDYTVESHTKMKSSRTRKSPGRTSSLPYTPPAGWMLARSGPIGILQASALAKHKWLIHGFSARTGGSSRLGEGLVLNLGETDWDRKKNVSDNRALLLAALQARNWPLATLHQCHTDVIHGMSEPSPDPPRGDALLTATPGLLLGVKTADCVPILLVDVKRRAVAAIHAGWRGTLARLTEKTLGRMRMEFGTTPKDVLAVLGPAIGSCCYEVGAEVAKAFAAQFDAAREWFQGPFEKIVSDDSPNPLRWLQMTPPGHDAPPPTVFLDLRAANRWQISKAGVPAAHIFVSDLCTACRTDLLFSHRREQGKTGRMMAVIGIRPAARRSG